MPRHSRQTDRDLQVTSVWLEAEQRLPGSWDPADTNSSVNVRLADGTRWWAMFATYANVSSLTQENRRTGEELHGQYLWMGHMILIEALTRPLVEQVSHDLLDSGHFHRAFEPLPNAEEAAGSA